MEIHSEGWDELERHLIATAEEDIAQSLARQAINDGAKSSGALNIDLAGLPDSCDADRVARRIRAIVGEELGS